MPKKVDTNHREIVNNLRKCGYSVETTHTVGNGFPDIAVGYCGLTFLYEIKRPGGKLNSNEIDWHDRWRGHVKTVWSWEDVVEDINSKMKSTFQNEKERA